MKHGAKAGFTHIPISRDIDIAPIYIRLMSFRNELLLMSDSATRTIGTRFKTNNSSRTPAIDF